MSVMAMKVVSAEQHPNADALRLYIMSAPEVETVQIIANLDNIYQIDDVVAVALSNSILKDGTKIKPSKLRGVYSYGMALGKVDAEVGTDLSELYCQPEVKATATEIQFIKWTSIELLHNVRNNLEAIDYAPRTLRDRTPVITYRAKIKLHGTNAAVRVSVDGQVAAQSRSQIITPQDDNVGFASWVSHNLDYFKQLKGERNLTIFGEWCGSNIQKGVAVSQIKRKVFAVFAIQYGGVNGQIARLEIRPEQIRDILPEHEDIFVLPYYGEPVTLDFSNREHCGTSYQCLAKQDQKAKAFAAATEQINSMVTEVETVDPWVKETFGVEGTGEGLVMYPEANEAVIREGYTDLMFKAKGEKHRVIKSKQAAQIDPEVARSIDEFANLFVTEARLEQALIEGCNGELNMRKMGQFLKWISLDIQKESQAELAAANLTWKQVNKSLSTVARTWYEYKVKQ